MNEESKPKSVWHILGTIAILFLGVGVCLLIVALSTVGSQREQPVLHRYPPPSQICVCHCLQGVCD